MDKEAAKKAVEGLVEKYRRADTSGAANKYSEEETKKNFILPLFRALGWDVDSEEVSAEENISGDRVDYGFYLDGRAQFYVEAKPAREDTEKQKFAEQAIGYSWNKGVTWAVLTNFKLLEIFNAEDATAAISAKRFKRIQWDEYIERFDELWLLSKDACREKLLDAEAEKVGKKLKRISVTSQLVEDLNAARELLSRMFITWNPKLELAKNPQLLDEGVQRVLDRIIFIRVAEDRGIEAPTLQPIVRTWEANWRAGKREYLYQSMEKKFRELDGIYNSNIFAKHPSDGWVDEKNSLEGIVDKFYGKPGYYSYDFKIIPADILGTVYEQYLGHRLAKLEKGDLFGESDLGVAKDARKRKEQGIYYTPRFIVDYIVENALGPVLEKCTSIHDLQKIKVLDPACGSGSFLIKALDLIYKKYQDFGAEGELIKRQILTNNLYGVDLDNQAVEIARLNLLLGALEERSKLPTLINIKNGNSLISGTDEELKKRFGKDWRDKKPFNWEKEFPEVFKQGGFDVVIGNPPYVRNRELDSVDKEFYAEKYVTASGQYDLYQLFFERSLEVLKEEGRVGFITSNKYAIADYGKALREHLLKTCKIISIVDVSNLVVFKDAATYPYIIILAKDENNQNNIISVFKPISETNLAENEMRISQAQLKASPSQAFTLKNENPLLGKIESISEKLGDICTIKETIHTGNIRQKLIVDEKIDEHCKKLLAGKDCHRYSFAWSGKWIRYDKKLIDKKKGEYANLVGPEYFEEPKLLLREISYNLEACYDNEHFYTLNKVYSIQTSSKYKLFFLLALLNSRLLTFYFRNKFEGAHVQNDYLQVKKIYSSQIPIRKIDFSRKDDTLAHDSIAELAEKMTDLNRELQKATENSEKWNKLKAEIERTDKEIDQEIYKLYGLTDKETQTIEGSI